MLVFNGLLRKYDGDDDVGVNADGDDDRIDGSAGTGDAENTGALPNVC